MVPGILAAAPARSRLIATILVTIMIMAGLTACTDDQETAASQSLDRFLATWRDGTIAERWPAYDGLVSGLAAESPALDAGDVEVDGDRASAPVTVTWTLPGGTRWQYETTVRLRRHGDSWQVTRSAATVHPGLSGEHRLVKRQGEDTRAPILDGTGKPITEHRPVVVVGVQPRKTTDAGQLARDLGRALAPDGVDTSGLPARIREADPDAFLPVVTLRAERYAQVRPAIHDLPGTVFREESRVLAPTREYARALLGTVGPVTKEQLDATPGKYQPTDQVGRYGLQARYDERLRGRPAVSVVIAGDGEAAEAAEKEVFRSEAQPGRPVQTTLDDRVQRAADAAVAAAPKTTAIAAIRVSDGAALAVANSPEAGARNLAMTAKVPPGSTFKMVSALTLMTSGAVAPDQPVRCPATATVQGRSFKNAWNAGLADATFRTAFAHSCNTTFVRLSPKLRLPALADTAAALGIGRQWNLGVPVHTGSVPTEGRPVEVAAASFGQGKTVVSPMAMAGATAGIARGTWQQPVLVRKPRPRAAASDGPPLDAQHLGDLRSMMRQVVTDGSAGQLNDIGGKPVHGKTGTAEYGTETPPRSHSWFAGWQGDIAFAVFVEDGGNDVSLAMAATHRFLTELGG